MPSTDLVSKEGGSGRAPGARTVFFERVYGVDSAEAIGNGGKSVLNRLGSITKTSCWTRRRARRRWRETAPSCSRCAKAASAGVRR